MSGTSWTGSITFLNPSRSPAASCGSVATAFVTAWAASREACFAANSTVSAMAAETDASTILWTSAAVSCPWAASWTDLAIEASNSPLVGTFWVAPVTAASTILAISAELTPSGTDRATACSTSGLISSVSSLGAGMAAIAASTTLFTSAAFICSPA